MTVSSTIRANTCFQEAKGPEGEGSPGERQGGRGEGAAGDAGKGCVTLCAWQPEPRRGGQSARRAPGSGKFREERVAPASGARRGPAPGEGRCGAKGGGREEEGRAGAPAPSPARPGGCSLERAPAHGGRRVTYLPTVWLASWRMRLNCFFIVAPLAR